MTRISRMLLLGVTALTPGFAWAQALPTGGTYVAGAGSINTMGATTTIDQLSARGVINWQSFSIGTHASVQFNNGSGATLNRVTGEQLSSLQGHLGATGTVFLINPNGVVIGPAGTVVTGGSFVASTRDTPNSAFMKGGNITLSGTSAGTVTNAGKITSTNGNVVLVGATASNSGAINAAGGTGALVVGNQVVLSEADGPAGIYVVADNKAKGNVTNTGLIKAAAATLASAGGNVYALAGNREGLVQATGTTTVNGQVWLSAPHGTVTVESATLSATNIDGSGGIIRANGEAVSLGGQAVLNASASRGARKGGLILVGTDSMGGTNLARSTTLASGAVLKATGKGTGVGGTIETSAHTLAMGAATISAGLGGSWLLDPDDLTIGSAAASTINTALNSGTNVTELTTATTASNINGAGASSSGTGDILLNAALSWNSTASLVLSAYHSISLNAGITVGGAGKLALTTNNNSGGTSTGDGALNFAAGASITFTDAGVGPALTINGDAYTLLSSANQLSSVASSGYYALAVDLDATSLGTLTSSLIASSAAFNGTLNGLGHTIANLTINNPSSEYAGLFGQVGSSGVLENISLTNANVTADATNGNSLYIGLLTGGNSGTITNTHVQGSLSVKINNSSSLYEGGLIGSNSGNISSSSADLDLSSSADSVNQNISIGGLVGYNASGDITGSYTNGTISGTNSEYIGGLVGYVSSSTNITNSYSQSNITSESAQTVGGLVGMFSGQSNNEIKNSYATGNISYSGQTSVGGLVGILSNGNILNSYETGDIIGTYNRASAIGGLIGMSASGTTISSSHATGSITADKTDSTVATIAYSGNFGGLIGYDGSDITDSYATGNIDTNGGQAVGGLVAYKTSGSILNSYTSGNLTAPNTTMVGGLVAFYMGGQGSISNSYASGNIKSTNSVYVGGFVGDMSLGKITNSHANGNINSENSQYIGGFIAYGDGTITNSYETGSIYAKTSLSNYMTLNAGGFVGTNTYMNISNSYASGNVSEISTSSNSSNLGGFVGTNNDSITDAYALGSVSKTGNGNINDNIGGFSGVNWGNIIDAYSIGLVEEKVNDGNTSKIGGFSGLNGNVITDGYFDTDTSGTIIGIGSANGTSTVTGLTTAEWIEKGPGSTSSQYAFVNPTLWAKGTPYAYLSTLPYVIITANGTQIYGTTAINAQINSAINQSGQNIASILSGDDLTWTGSALTDSSVGSSYSMYGTTYALDGYQATYTNPGSNLAVTPASLTVTLDNQSGTYGQTPTLNQSDYSVSGLVNGDTVSSVLLSTNASAKSNVGEYYIHGTISGDALKNYTISYKNSVYTVNPASLIITASNQSGTYGETPSLNLSDYTTSGLVNGDDVSSIALLTNANSKSSVGNYALLASSANGQGLSNYSISYTKATYTITPAALTITARNQSGTYGGTPTLDKSAYTVVGLVNGDTVSSVLLFTNAKTLSAIGDYLIFVSSARGSGLGNYRIKYDSGVYDILSKNNRSNDQIKQDVIFWPLISTFGGSIEPCHTPQTFLVNCLKSRNSNALSPAVSQATSYRIEYPSLSYSNHLKDTF